MITDAPPPMENMRLAALWGVKLKMTPGKPPRPSRRAFRISDRDRFLFELETSLNSMLALLSVVSLNAAESPSPYPARTLRTRYSFFSTMREIFFSISIIDFSVVSRLAPTGQLHLEGEPGVVLLRHVFRAGEEDRDHAGDNREDRVEYHPLAVSQGPFNDARIVGVKVVEALFAPRENSVQER